MNSVLVIDDDPDVRDGIERILARAGYAVRTIGNASEAILELGRATVEVVITDIIMPKLNGVDAIKLIAHEFPAVRIVAISGGGNFDVIGNNSLAMTTTSHLAAAKHAGAHYILKKPFEAAELIQAVQKAIEDGSP